MPISYSWATISAPVGCLLLSITIIEKLIGILSPSQPGKKEDESLPQPQNAGYTESCD
jgi:TRAP-type C4-dicarboxylate transport system permease small subunit